MKPDQLVLIMAKNWNQYMAGEGWLIDNGHLEGLRRRPRFVESFNCPRKLQGIKDGILFIMDEACTNECGAWLTYGRFAARNRIIEMQDTRDRPNLNFKLTEILDHGKRISS